MLKLLDDGQHAEHVENLPDVPGGSVLRLKAHLEAIAEDFSAGDYLAVRIFQNGFTETANVEVVQPPMEVTVEA